MNEHIAHPRFLKGSLCNSKLTSEPYKSFIPERLGRNRTQSTPVGQPHKERAPMLIMFDIMVVVGVPMREANLFCLNTTK